MIKKILLVFFIFCCVLFASEKIEITYKNTNIKEFSMGYLHDNLESLKIEDIVNSDFKKTTNSSSFGTNHKITWYKIKIKNSTNVDKKIYLHSNLAYMSSKVSVYEFDENRQVDQNIYDVYSENIKTKLTGKVLVYAMILSKNSTKTVYIKNKTQFHQLVDFSLHDQHDSSLSLINKNFYSNIIVAFLFSLSIYNLLLFLITKRKEFLYYALYLGNAFFGFFYMYGSLAHNLNIYGSQAYVINITAILAPLFLVLFTKSLFDVTKSDKTLNTVLNVVLYIIMVYIGTALFIDFDFAIKSVAFIFIFTFIVMIYTGIYFYKKKHPLAKIFLLAYVIYMLGACTTLYMLMGKLSYSFLVFHASGITVLIEGVLFSYLIYHRIELLKLAIIKHQKSLIFKNKKAQIGDMTGAITHQWKQPLTAISSIVTGLEYRLDKQKEVSAKYLKPKLSQINEKIVFLVETVEDFKHFFNPERIYEDVDVSHIIGRVISLSCDDMLSENISIKSDLNFTKMIHLYPNELLHIILNLIQNSKEAFEKNKITARVIKIVGMTKEGRTIIDIIDNAGGISEEMISKVFDESYTTKKDKVGSGLGLYLSKFILEEHMNGSIEVKKIKNGTMFRIIL